MDATYDELAGVVDLFGGLTREELEAALVEVAFRADGQSVDEGASDRAIQDAIDEYYLVPLEHDDQEVLVAGPTALPTTPEHADDLPHILDVDRRVIDRENAGAQLQDRFRGEVETALAADDRDRAERLIDVSYDAETWAPIDLSAERSRLDEHIE